MKMRMNSKPLIFKSLTRNGFACLCILVALDAYNVQAQGNLGNTCSQFEIRIDRGCGRGRIYKNIRSDGRPLCTKGETGAADWKTAEKNCKLAFGSLVWFDDNDEIAIVSDGNFQEMWTGYNDREEEGVVVYEKKRPGVQGYSKLPLEANFTFSPNATNTKNDSCVVLEDQTLKWADCKQEKPYVCRLESHLAPLSWGLKPLPNKKELLYGAAVSIICNGRGGVTASSFLPVINNGTSEIKLLPPKNMTGNTFIGYSYTADPPRKPLGYLGDVEVGSPGKTVKPLRIGSLHTVKCLAPLGNISAMGFGIVAYGGKDACSTTVVQNVYPHSQSKDKKATWPAEFEEINATLIDRMLYIGSNVSSFAFDFRITPGARRTRFRCCTGIIGKNGCTPGFGLDWPLLDIWYGPGTPILDHDFNSSRVTVFGGDRVVLSCRAQIGDYDPNQGLVWKVTTETSSFTVTGQYTGAEPNYPWWMNITAVPGSLRCPPGEQVTSSRACIRHVEQEVTWHDAKKICNETGSMLVSILDRETYDKMAYKGKSFWISLNDIENEGHYVWLDGTNILPHFLKMSDAENSKQASDRRDQDCGFLHGTWGMADCDEKRPFICMTKPETVAEQAPKSGKEQCLWKPSGQTSRIEIQANAALEGGSLSCLSFSEDLKFLLDADMKIESERVSFTVYFETQAPEIERELSNGGNTMKVKCAEYVGTDARMRVKVSNDRSEKYIYEASEKGFVGEKAPFVRSSTYKKTMHDIFGPHVVSELVFDMSQVQGFLYVNCYPVSTTAEKLKTQLSQTDLVASLRAEGRPAPPPAASPAAPTAGIELPEQTSHHGAPTNEKPKEADGLETWMIVVISLLIFLLLLLLLLLYFCLRRRRRRMSEPEIHYEPDWSKQKSSSVDPTVPGQSQGESNITITPGVAVTKYIDELTKPYGSNLAITPAYRAVEKKAKSVIEASYWQELMNSIWGSPQEPDDSD